MAGIFDVGVGEVVNSNVTPQTPPAPVKNIALGMLAGAVGVGAEMFKKNQELEAKKASEEAKGRVLSSINSKIEAITQAKNSGKIKESAANMQISVLNKSVMAANPSYAEDIQKFFNSKLGGGWSGGIIKEEDEAERIRKAQIDGANSAGYIPRNATPDEIELGIAKYQRLQAHQIETQATMDELTILGKKQSQTIAKSAEERARENQDRVRLERRLTDGLYTMLPFEMDTSVEELNKDYDKWVSEGRTPAGGEELYSTIMLKKEAAKKRLLEVGKFSPDTAKAISSTLSMYDIFAEKVKTNDERQLKVLTDRFNLQKQVALMAAVSKMKPSDKNTVMLSAGFPHFVAVQNKATAIMAKKDNQPTDEDVMRIWAMNGNGYDVTFNPFSKDPEEAAAAKEYSAKLLAGYDRAVTSGDNEAVGDFNVQINAYMRSLRDHSGSIRTPADLSTAVSFLSDPKVGKWLSSGGADKDAVEAAKSVYQNYYRDEVLKSAENLFQGNIVIGSKFTGGQSNVINISKDLEPRLEGGRVSFAKAGQAFVDPEVRNSQQLKDLSNILNNFLAVSKNLEGKDEQWTFENVIKPYVFGIKPEDKKEKKDGGS